MPLVIPDEALAIPHIRQLATVSSTLNVWQQLWRTLPVMLYMDWKGVRNFFNKVPLLLSPLSPFHAHGPWGCLSSYKETCRRRTANRSGVSSPGSPDGRSLTAFLRVFSSSKLLSPGRRALRSEADDKNWSQPGCSVGDKFLTRTEKADRVMEYPFYIGLIFPPKVNWEGSLKFVDRSTA